MRVRITARITKYPELVVLIDDRIAAQLIQQRCPAGRGILQPVGQQHRDLVGIIRLEPDQTRRIRIVAGTDHPRPSAVGMFAPQAAISVKYPCQAPFGSVQISAAEWAGGLVNTGHDGATFTVHSNYRAGRPPNPPATDCAACGATVHGAGDQAAPGNVTP